MKETATGWAKKSRPMTKPRNHPGRLPPTPAENDRVETGKTPGPGGWTNVVPAQGVAPGYPGKSGAIVDLIASS